jgi:hypothetical protein
MVEFGRCEGCVWHLYIIYMLYIFYLEYLEGRMGIFRIDKYKFIDIRGCFM